ncbi:RluA family pseudouridine synthase [Bernardetia sp. ABR2-2B]|uniref:RluA family pseudouridine synthase n=1 Tax=Bernardetia sp. ABR2-2B TaxID=3127472 RepID=UPI0030D462A9
MAIIHKPAGILVSGNSFKTIANALPQNLKKSNLDDSTIPQPVHRLDYGTTGVLLVGKTASSIRALNKLFENKEIEKMYYAVSIGKMKELGGIIKTEVDKKEAQSDYQIIKSVKSERFEFLNLVKLEPKTGRRHQLRVHLASIGNPILGDKDYGIENLILNGKGIYLHAYRLEFVHPFTKEIISIEDELPQKFLKLFNP